MTKFNILKHALCLFFIFITLFRSTLSEDDKVKGEKISLSVPQLSEEENESTHMPKHLRCDACLAVVHQVYTAFTKAREKKKSVKESDILDILENTCNNAFNDYGLKQVDGINRISGPGLETEHVMGMTQMGGRWPHRLQEMCHYYIGEAGEYDIYEIFTEGKDKLTEFLCYGKGIYSHCTPLKPSLRTEL